MKKQANYITYYFSLYFLLSLVNYSFSQEVEIQDFSLNEFGQIEIEIESSEDKYYILFGRNTLRSRHFPLSMAMGTSGKLVMSESLSALPDEYYKVIAYDIDNPGDLDRDNVDDIKEFQEFGKRAPFNPAKPIPIRDGVVSIATKENFQDLSYKGPDVLIDTHLRDLEFVKFYILDAQSEFPRVYFMNTLRHRAHFLFADAIGIPNFLTGPVFGQMRGEIVYHPFVDDPTGRPGVYRFEFEPNDNYSFEEVRKIYELLASHMPFLQNNWTYYPMPNAALPRYIREKVKFDNSRIQVLLEEDLFFDISYIPFNQTESYGFLRAMELDERPNPRDIVLYESLPNELPRVGGIITTVPQTPLSHVNLRALQDGVPNAYIRGARDVKKIDALIGKYVYYKVEQGDYIIREAQLAEVEAYYSDIRPAESQSPPKDLTVINIKALDDISFEESSSFGAKTANVATMRTFGFPSETIPNGYGIPFYFYDEFMKHNDFYARAQVMMDDSAFQTDADAREDGLKEFRSEIKDGELPAWMYDALTTMQNSFPEGTSIRCRSSSNNEDLPGFVGAGLYDSKTQKPEEGHIEKSIKQVYASMWNFRAFDERQFYRIDHMQSAMGVLCHPNFKDEQANGVGVSLDPINDRPNRFYINTQVGEDLVTNPEALSIPEEILIDANRNMGNFFQVIRSSNQVSDGDLIMNKEDIASLQSYLRVIHDNFKVLYEAEATEDFAMEIEYKITDVGDLSIKQARPWAAYWASFNMTTATEDVSPTFDAEIDFALSPNPSNHLPRIEFSSSDQLEFSISLYNSSGQLLGKSSHMRLQNGSHLIRVRDYVDVPDDLPEGLYRYIINLQMQEFHQVLTKSFVLIPDK